MKKQKQKIFLSFSNAHMPSTDSQLAKRKSCIYVDEHTLKNQAVVAIAERKKLNSIIENKIFLLENIFKTRKKEFFSIISFVE